MKTSPTRFSSWITLSLVAVGLFSCIARADGTTARPSWFPKVSCKQAWSKLIPNNQHQFQIGKDSYESYAQRTNRKNCYKDWEIIVYIAAENDLEPYAYWDLYEMEAGFSGEKNVAASTLKTDLIVQLDATHTSEIRRLHIFQSPESYNSKLSLSDFQNRTADQVQSPVISKIQKPTSETNAQKAQSFEDFVDWAIRNYPAENTMVIVWGHGEGWAPGSTRTRRELNPKYLNPSDLPSDPTPTEKSPGSSPFTERGFGGIAFDQSTGAFLDIPALRGALSRVVKKTLEGRPFDLYASDACLMQMIEVATEVSPTARFIVGSTQVQNFLGLPYRRMLYELNTGRFMGAGKSIKTSDEPFLMARMIPDIFRSVTRTNGLQKKISPDAVSSVTMSSLSTSELKELLLPSLQNFSLALKAYLKEDSVRAIDLEFALQGTPGFMGNAQEIGVFLGLVDLLVRKESEEKKSLTPVAQRLKDSISEAKSALNRTLVAYTFGTRYASKESELYLLGFKGISAWLPSSPEDYSSRIQAFRSSQFYKKVPAWGSWMKTLYQNEY